MRSRATVTLASIRILDLDLAVSWVLGLLFRFRFHSFDNTTLCAPRLGVETRGLRWGGQSDARSVPGPK